MVMAYICTEKCFFHGKVYEKGQRLFLDSSVGDQFPHFTRYEKTEESSPRTKAPAKAGAKSVSKDGGKAG